MAALENTIVGNWNELQQLQRETELLIQSAKSVKQIGLGAFKVRKTAKIVDHNKLKSQHDEVVQKEQSGKQSVKKKIKKAANALKLALKSELQTRSLYGIPDTRMTVEVLDDGSPDNTPRLDIDVLAREQRIASIKESQKVLKNISLTEEKFRTLGFEFEKDRVKTKLDTFFGAPGISAEDVQAEKERLHRIEESIRIKQMNDDDEVNQFKEMFEQDKAAVKFQKAFRGFIGRQKSSLTKRLRELEEDGTSDWVEVRDRSSGDVWFYNKSTGVSQWERPDEMFAKLSSKSAIKILPNISRSNTTEDYDTGMYGAPGLNPNTLRASKTASKSTRVQTTLPSLDATQQAKFSKSDSLNIKTVSFDSDAENLNEAEAMQELKEELDGRSEKDTFFTPAGYFKPDLRSTIVDALLESRFDTVSTVMADDKWLDADKDPFLEEKKRRSKVIDSSGVKKGDRVNPYLKSMVSVPTFNVKSKKNVMQFDPIKDPLTEAKNMTLNDLSVKDVEHPGFEVVDHQNHNMCFGCWSAGLNKSCAMHQDPDVKLKPSQTMLLCRNWDLDVMRKRYRAEELQEIFMKRGSSLRYDVKRKMFSTVIETKHQIYKGLNRFIDRLNFKALLWIKTKRWMVGFTEEVRLGHAKTNKKAADRAKLMQLKRTLQAQVQVYAFLQECLHRLPVPPITGYSWEERTATDQYLFKHFDVASGQDVELIKIRPMPLPRQLFKPREYFLGIPRTIPMPRPEYTAEAEKNTFPSTKYFPENNPGAWIERLCAATVRESISCASDQIKAITPMPGLELIRRTKQPPPCSIKFATIGRKPTPENLAVGGLSVELLIYQIITSYIPPQYGNMMVMDKASIYPGISPEVTISFKSLLMAPVAQKYINRQLEHPLNYRRSPTVTINSLVQVDVKFHYGTNRPEQTGENESHGFRTTTWTKHIEVIIETDPTAFIPSEEIVSLNNPGFNNSRTTHADLSYPFCEPSTRDNSTLDFFHLLLTGAMSAAKTQVFTALTVQEPGLFLKGSRADLPLGHLVVSVYRSWAFTQKDTIEEFKTDDGVSYWYHRRTGQTFWERPLYEEEEPSAMEGGTILDMNHKEEPLLTHAGAEGAVRRYDQGEFRKKMLMHIESNDDAETRRSAAANAARVARVAGQFGNVPATQAMTANQDFRMDQGSIVGVSNVQGDNIYAASIQNTSPSRQGHESPPSRNVVRGSLLDEDSVAFAQQMRNSHNGMHDHGSINQVSKPHTTPTPPGMDMTILPGVTNNMMMDLTQNLSKMLTGMMMNHANPQEMIQLGMGMGMALLNSGAPQGFVDHTIYPKGVNNGVTTDSEGNFLLGSGEHEEGHNSGGFFPQLSEEESLAARNAMEIQSHISQVSSAQPLGRNSGADHEPIGEPHPNIHFSENKSLDKRELNKVKEETANQLNKPLTSMQNARQTKVVLDLTETPDERPPPLTNELPLNAEMAMKEKVPILVYPQLSTQTEGGAPAEYLTHPAAGENVSFVKKENEKSQTHVKGSNVLRRKVMPIPTGFANAIFAKRAAKSEVDYLPQVPNLPTARTVGRVKPRSSAMDWLAVAFDPWSAGKRPLNAEFVASLAAKADKIFRGKSTAEALDTMDALKEASVKGAFVTVDDEEGEAKKRAEISKAQILSAAFKQVCSLARHNKYADVEELLNQPDWSVPIDFQDELGNSLLHMGSQNGNRRMIKLCLKRQANINIQNLTGQTPLHFAFGYGYTELGDYLLKKGADDTIKNEDGLTCYEGFGAHELGML